MKFNADFTALPIEQYSNEDTILTSNSFYFFIKMYGITFAINFQIGVAISSRR